MILRKKRPHLVFKTPLAVMRLLVLDVSHQHTDVGGAYRKQPIPTLPCQLLHALLLHPDRRSRFDLRHNFRRRLRGRQTQRQMDLIGHASGAETFAIQLPCRGRQIRVQGDLGLRPRLVCRRAFGPYMAATPKHPRKHSNLHRNLNPGHRHPSGQSAHRDPIRPGLIRNKNITSTPKRSGKIQLHPRWVGVADGRPV